MTAAGGLFTRLLFLAAVDETATSVSTLYLSTLSLASNDLTEWAGLLLTFIQSRLSCTHGMALALRSKFPPLWAGRARLVLISRLMTTHACGRNTGALGLFYDESRVLNMPEHASARVLRGRSAPRGMILVSAALAVADADHCTGSDTLIC